MATSIDPNSKTGGLLLAASQANLIDPITWVDVTVDGLVVSVASDALRAQLGDRASVRMPVSYQEVVAICQASDWVSPTQAFCDAIFAAAGAQLVAAALPASAQMDTVQWTYEFGDKVDRQLAAAGTGPGDLVFGAWKLWILHPRIVEMGAVNYGFWGADKKPIQTVGGRHNAEHYDYSQLLQPVKRRASRVDTGDAVDLLQYIAEREKIPASYLDVYGSPA